MITFQPNYKPISTITLCLKTFKHGLIELHLVIYHAIQHFSPGIYIAHGEGLQILSFVQKIACFSNEKQTIGFYYKLGNKIATVLYFFHTTCKFTENQKT